LATEIRDAESRTLLTIPFVLGLLRNFDEEKGRKWLKMTLDFVTTNEGDGGGSAVGNDLADLSGCSKLCEWSNKENPYLQRG